VHTSPYSPFDFVISWRRKHGVTKAMNHVNV
jgi:hypothetical protein